MSLFFQYIKGLAPHLGKRDTDAQAIDSIQRVTHALQSSGLISHNIEEDDTEDEIFKRSMGISEVTTDMFEPPSLRPSTEPPPQV